MSTFLKVIGILALCLLAIWALVAIGRNVYNAGSKKATRDLTYTHKTEIAEYQKASALAKIEVVVLRALLVNEVRESKEVQVCETVKVDGEWVTYCFPFTYNRTGVSGLGDMFRK